MKLTDYITLDAPTRFRKMWRATFAGWDTMAFTKENAITDLFAQLERVSQHSNTRIYRAAKDGTIFCLYFAYDSWCYDIVRADRPNQPSSCHMSVKTYTEALAQMQAHVDQYGD